MKRIFLLAIFTTFLALPAQAQNVTTISASNLQDINGVKLAAGQLCFLVTDQNDNPISVSLGGGGQTLRRGYCSQVTNGVAGSFTVPNPASTLPTGIYYRVTVRDTSTGQEVLRYTQVTFTGATFNFDNYAPANIGSFALLTGNNVSGNLGVAGNLSATGTITASNIPGSIPGAGSCTNQFVRTLTSGAPPTCGTVGSADLASSLALNTATITSATASAATAGSVRLASGDAIDWRNNAGAANLPLQKTGAASGNTPADSLDASAFGGIKAPSLLQIGGTDTGFSRTAAGTVALGNGAQGDATAIMSLAGIGLAGAGGTAGVINGATGWCLQGSGSCAITIRNTGAQLNAPLDANGQTIKNTGTLTLPTSTDTLVARNTTDTLTNKGFGDKVTLYNNILTSGNGLAATYGIDDQTSKSTSIGLTTLVAGGGSTGGRYRINYDLGITTSDGSGATVTVAVNWTQDGISRSSPSTTVPFTAATNGAALALPIFADNSTNISYMTTVAGTPTTGRYGVHIWATKE